MPPHSTKFLTLIYTHFPPFVQSNTNLGTAVRGFCRCNEPTKSVDIEYGDHPGGGGGTDLIIRALLKKRVLLWLIVGKKVIGVHPSYLGWKQTSYELLIRTTWRRTVGSPLVLTVVSGWQLTSVAEREWILSTTSYASELGRGPCNPNESDNPG